MNQQAERRVGTIIGGKWRVDSLLGSGSMAAVYAVTHRNGARAALKILHPTLCTDPAVCERFLGEGYLANSVKHSGIVRVFDDGVTDDGCVFLTMDLLEGDTLETLRQKRGNRIPIVEALDLADKLMDVLSAVHAAGIIHRDLKPQNVFVCDDGVLTLLDFGVARVFDRTSQSKLSMFGLVLGTPSFMSPEQALGSRDKVDHRSDIWSFGATLFTALTGETVHLGANVQAKLLAAATVKARSIAMVMPELPAGIAAAIDQALRFKKEDRWQSTDAMRRAFRDSREAAGLGRALEPARAFDMSLDESTHASRSALVMLESARPKPAATGEPPEGPFGTFIGIGTHDGKVASIVGNDGTVPPPPAFIVQAAAQSPATLGSFRPPMASLPPPLPPRARGSASAPAMPGALPRPTVPPVFGEMRELRGTSGAPGTAGTPGSSAVGLSSNTGQPLAGHPLPGVPVGPSPAAVMHRLPPPGPAGPRGSRPDGQEATIPVYRDTRDTRNTGDTGNTRNLGGAEDSIDEAIVRDAGVRRKSSVGVWFMAALLTAAVLGGIAFFAVKRAPLSNDVASGAGTPIETSAATAVTAAPPAPLVAASRASSTPSGPLPATTASEPRGTFAALTKDATVPTPPAVTPTPPARPAAATFPWRPANNGNVGRGPRNASRPTIPEPASTPESPRPTPPGLAPDPFGTPE